MGVVYVKAVVSGSKGEETVEFLVDSGARFTVLPNAIWKKIGLKPKRAMEFILADGTTIKRKVSECLFRYDSEEGHTPVVLGEKNDVALLGVITLEEFNLVLNPFNRTLRPAPPMMM